MCQFVFLFLFIFPGCVSRARRLEILRIIDAIFHPTVECPSSINNSRQKRRSSSLLLGGRKCLTNTETHFVYSI